MSEENKLETRLYKKVFGPYKNDRGRLFVRVEKKDGTYKTISYPKFLMEEWYGKELDADEHTVDHINGDKTDDRIENYRLIDRKTHSTMDTRRVKLIELTCDLCEKKFLRSPRLLRIKAKLRQRGHFCSRRCAGMYGRRLALNKIKKMKLVRPVKSEYYKLHDYGNE
jgi:hypothetical protein